MATTAATATALHGDPTACHGNPHGTPMSTAPRVGLGLGIGLGFQGMPRRSEEGSVVCRGRFCRRWCHGMPRPVAEKDNNAHVLLYGDNTT